MEIASIVIENQCRICRGEKRTADKVCDDYTVIEPAGSPWGPNVPFSIKRTGAPPAFKYRIVGLDCRPEDETVTVLAVRENAVEVIGELPCIDWGMKIKDLLWSKGVRFIAIYPLAEETPIPPEVPGVAA